MSNDSLPHIVQCLRDQRPGVVPEWLHWCTANRVWHDLRGPCCDRTHSPRVVYEEAVIAIVEAGLWRELRRENERNPEWWADVEWCGNQWLAVREHVHSVRVPTDFGSAPLSLTLALCYAIGVDL